MNPQIVYLRTMQFSFVGAVGLLFFVSRTLPPSAHPVNASAQWALVACALAAGLLGFILQRILLRSSDNPFFSAHASPVLSRWRAGHLIRFASAEAVALFGLSLRSLGAPLTTVYSLFGAGLVLLILWQPGPVPTESKPQNIIG